MGVLQALKHLQLIQNHPLVALDILLQNDLDCDLTGWSLSCSDDAICSSTECPAESIS